MKTIQYNHNYSKIEKNEIVNKTDVYNITTKPKKNDKKLCVLLIGLGGNNGTTLVSSILADRKKLEWNNKNGKHKINFLGSISQFGSVPIGYDENNNLHSKLFKEIGDLYKPEDLEISGWDICKDNLYEAAKKSKIIDHDLLEKLKSELIDIEPLPSLYNPDFIASNQKSRADNIINFKNISESIDYISNQIKQFQNIYKKIILVWSASTERFHNGKWKNKEELDKAILENDKELSPSILFAVAAARNNCIFLNGSPQNTLCPAVIDNARFYKSFVGGEDFKTGQTKLKSVLVDWLASSGIRPLSIVSYNHLGNNDGKNLDETPQFKSKEITKKNVIDDVVEENPILFSKGKPDHVVVIKYIPAVGDSKRAMDEYYSELFLDGRHTLAIHNICEDSLLAVPLILDIILFSEFFSRISIEKNNKEIFKPVLSFLSFFFKAPAVNENENIINAFFKQRYGLGNFFRILLGIPVNNFTFLEQKY
jgi:myo-inositol-1-phosphate synthase